VGFTVIKKGSDKLEFSFLYALQEINNAVLDPIMIIASTLGNDGLIWIVITVVLLFTKRYRECAIVMAIALLLSLLICNLTLKNLVARDRPFWIDEQVVLKIEEPTDFSFPSGHTFSSFAAAVTLFLYSRKMGTAALALAFTIAFSRLYLFVHFPTDVLASVVLGSATAGLAVVLFRKILLPTMKRAGWIALPVDVIEVLPVDTADTLPVDEVPEGGENEPGND